MRKQGETPPPWNSQIPPDSGVIVGDGQVQNTLDPLLEVMTRDYIDDTDLTGRLNALFKVCEQTD